MLYCLDSGKLQLIIGRPNQDEIILSRILEKTIRRSSALDTESLCIVAGSKCFALRADVHILNHDGNLIDASCVALIAALQHFRRPDVSIEGEKVTIFDVRDREPVPLSMLHHPLCVTVSYCNDGESVILDATAAEEQVRDTHVIIGMNKHGELCQVAKYGGSPIDPFSVVNCTKQALPKVQELSKLIDAKLAEDAKKRDAKGLMAELRAENDR
jgi:exosome complex component RRP45